MFRRTLQVDVVKKNKTQHTNPEKTERIPDNRLAQSSVVIESAIKKIGLFVCAYVILDTFRKVAVASVTE